MEDSLQQELAPPASVAHRQEPTAWSPESQASDVTHKELEAQKRRDEINEYAIPYICGGKTNLLKHASSAEVSELVYYKNCALCTDSKSLLL